MTFKLLIGDKDNVDFDAPIHVSPDQKIKLMSFFKHFFNPVTIVENAKFRPWRMNEDGRIQYPRTWEAEEYEILLNADSIAEAADRLGRSDMSILVHDGVWEPDFQSWCEEKNKDFLGPNKLEIIKEFLKEKKDKITSRRNEQKEQRKTQKQIEELQKEITDLGSDTTRLGIELLIKVGKLKGTVEEVIEAKKQKLRERIKELNKVTEEGQAERSE